MGRLVSIDIFRNPGSTDDNPKIVTIPAGEAHESKLWNYGQSGEFFTGQCVLALYAYTTSLTSTFKVYIKNYYDIIGVEGTKTQLPNTSTEYGATTAGILVELDLYDIRKLIVANLYKIRVENTGATDILVKAQVNLK